MTIFVRILSPFHPGVSLLRSRSLHVCSVISSLRKQTRLSEENENKKRKKSPKIPLKVMYRQEGRFSNVRDLAEHLAENIVYYDPENDSTGLIALNKPAGLPLKECEESPLSLKGVLQHLKELLEVPNLYHIRMPERFCSGLTMLTTEKATIERVKKCMRKNAAMKNLHLNFLALTHSFPRMDNKFETVDLLLKEVKSRSDSPISKQKEPVVMRTLCSKNALKESREGVERLNVFSQTLSRSGSGKAALVSVQTHANPHHFVQIYLADLLSPVLGDRFFSYRAKDTMGFMTKISHELSPDTAGQILPHWMKDKLKLKWGEENTLPKHLHLARIHLPGFLGKEKDLTLFCPPPLFFMRTAKMLDIDVDLDKIFSEDNVHSRESAVNLEEKMEKSQEEELEITHFAKS